MSFLAEIQKKKSLKSVKCIRVRLPSGKEVYEKNNILYTDENCTTEYHLPIISDGNQILIEAAWDDRCYPVGVRDCMNPVESQWVLLGSQDACSDKKNLHENGVTHILNLAGGGVENKFPDSFEYLSLNVLDTTEQKLPLREAFDFLESARVSNGQCLVHCNAGVSRSASIVIAYVMSKSMVPFEDAWKQVKECKRDIRPNDGFVTQLKQWGQEQPVSRLAKSPKHFRESLYTLLRAIPGMEKKTDAQAHKMLEELKSKTTF